jgi:hypothetical protein
VFAEFRPGSKVSPRILGFLTVGMSVVYFEVQCDIVFMVVCDKRVNLSGFSIRSLFFVLGVFGRGMAEGFALPCGNSGVRLQGSCRQRM